MAGTDFPVNHSLAVKQWSSDLMKEALKRTQIIGFAGKDSNSIIQIKTELGKDPGDRIRFGIRQQLSGGGVAGDGTLEGNEENLETYNQDIYIDQLRHAVRSSGKMSEQRVPFSVRSEARDGLADWWADRMDTWGFQQLCGNALQADVRYTGMQACVAPDTDHLVLPDSKTSELSLSATTTHKLTLALIDTAVEKAKVAKNAMRPIRVGANDFFVMFVDPAMTTDLRTNTQSGQWMDIQKAAMAGGKVTDNPIFTGALGVSNGVILHETTRLPEVGLAAGGQTTVRRAPLCGAQAAALAFGRGHGKNTFSWTEELFDYDNQLGVAAGTIAGLQKIRFNGSDFATIVVSVACPRH